MAIFVEPSPELCVAAVVAVLIVPLKSPKKVVAVAVPMKVGDAIGAFRSSAVCVAVLTGLSASLVLSTLVKPTIVLSIPDTVPVKVGSAMGAFKSNVVLVLFHLTVSAAVILLATELLNHGSVSVMAPVSFSAVAAYKA